MNPVLAFLDVTFSAGSSVRLLLVDGHAYAYRSFHAIRGLASPTGQPTNAIFGFVRAVTNLFTNLAPTHAAVVWDGGLAAERLALLPAYKAQRPPMPPALAGQLDGMVSWLSASGISSFRQDGIEADDAVATLALRAAGVGARVVIASPDKDFLQLVSPQIGVINPNEKTGRIWSVEDVVAKTGVRPEQIVDWLCLVGDAVDNIPGIPGIGVKTAATLLQKFDTCERLLERAAEMEPNRLRLSLLAGASVLSRNREMVRLRTHLDVPLSLDQLRKQPANSARLAALYRDWGFHSLLAEVDPPASPQTSLGL